MYPGEQSHPINNHCPDLILTVTLKVTPVILPILQMVKLRLRAEG